nr:isoform 2 of cyclin-l1-1 [Quercus suber]
MNNILLCFDFLLRISFSSPYWPLHHHTTTGPLPNSQARPPPVSSMVIGARDAHTIIKPYESMAVISSKKVASCLNYLKLCRPGRFYNIVSIARNRLPASMFKKVAASCLWLASKLEESPRKARQVLIVFHRIECRMENLPIEHLEIGSQKYHDLKTDLSRTERHVLKEMGFVCHVEHPHKFISNYLAILETPPELRQEAWNLANDRSMEKPRTMEDGTDRTKPWQLSEIVDAVQCRLVTMPEGTDSSSKVVRLLYANSGIGVLALGSNGVQKLWKWARSERMTTVWKPKPAAQIRASRIAMSLAERQSLDVVVKALLKT